MSNAHVDKPSGWKMRSDAEPVPIGKRDPFRTVRGILWWLSASLLFWSVIVAAVLLI